MNIDYLKNLYKKLNIKKYINFRISLAFFTLSALGLWADSPPSAFKLEIDKDNIKVFTRVHEGATLKEFKGVVTIRTSLSALVALMDDTNSYTNWMHDCVKSALVEHPNPSERTTYIVNDAPWPVSQRDMFIYSRTTQNKETKMVTIALEGRATFRPEIKGYVRVTTLKGSWRFTPLKKGLIEVTYQVYSDPGGSLPQILANSTVVDIPYHTLKNMRTFVQQERYQKAKYKEIMEP